MTCRTSLGAVTQVTWRDHGFFISILADSTTKANLSFTLLPHNIPSSLFCVASRMFSIKSGCVFTETSLPEFIFAIGGPGAGKRIQCSLLAEKYGFWHFSLGNILRAEASAPGSKRSDIIRRNIQEGAVGSKEMTVELLKTVVNNLLAICTPKYILIDDKMIYPLRSRV